MKKILVVTTFNNHFHFFHRLSQALKNSDLETEYITNKYSIYKEAESLGVNVDLLQNTSGFNADVNLSKSFEVAAGFLDKVYAEKVVSSVWSLLSEKVRQNKYEYFFIWGGVRLIELTASIFAEKYNIKTLFFELGNFPKKIFVDPKGTNARSLLAENPSILLSQNYDLDSYRKWSKNYIVDGLRIHAVPQSKSAGNVEYLKNVYDIFGFQFKQLIQTEPVLTREKIAGKFLRKIFKLKYDEVNLTGTKYLFYPMQVNKDAQLILNSRVGNLDALRIANDNAKETGLRLLVKPHPGEVEYGFIQKVNRLKEKLGFAFVNYNTIELIKNAEEVITVNSTVGLQAKIVGTKISCLGKAFYENFNDDMLAAYTQSYLIDADFWNSGEISIESAKKILSRAELN